MMKVAAIRDLSEAKILEMIVSLKKERLTLRMKRSQGEGIKLHRLKEIRCQIAQALTVLHEKKVEDK